MLFSELIPLSARLAELGHHITVETAGTLHLPVTCHLMSISPKLASSTPPEEQAGRWTARHARSRHVPEVVRRLVREYPYQVKFVVDQLRDLDELEHYLAEMPEIARERVLLMPQGTDRCELAEKRRWVEPYCHEHGLTFGPRAQIEWFGLQRGT